MKLKTLLNQTMNEIRRLGVDGDRDELEAATHRANGLQRMIGAGFVKVEDVLAVLPPIDVTVEVGAEPVFDEPPAPEPEAEPETVEPVEPEDEAPADPETSEENTPSDDGDEQ